MIQRVILGAILVSMMASPLSASQAMRRAATVGACAVAQTGRGIPQAARGVSSKSETLSAIKSRMQRFAEDPFKWFKLSAIGVSAFTGSCLFVKAKDEVKKYMKESEDRAFWKATRGFNLLSTREKILYLKKSLDSRSHRAIPCMIGSFIQSFYCGKIDKEEERFILRALAHEIDFFNINQHMSYHGCYHEYKYSGEINRDAEYDDEYEGISLLLLQIIFDVGLKKEQQEEVLSFYKNKTDLSQKELIFCLRASKRVGDLEKERYFKRVYLSDNALVPFGFDSTILTRMHAEMHAHDLKKDIEFIPGEVKEVCDEMILYADVKEAHADKVTFFHGQGWEWNLPATITKKLYEKKYGIKIGDFSFLRFDFDYSHSLTSWLEYFGLKSKKYLSEEGQQELKERGVRQSFWYFEKDRSSVLFGNLCLYANEEGSNTVKYVVHNCDQSILYKRNRQKLSGIFKNFGFEKEIVKLQEENPKIFKTLYHLHQKASHYGNFVTISIPKKLIPLITYPTESGGQRLYKSESELKKSISKAEMRRLRDAKIWRMILNEPEEKISTEDTYCYETSMALENAKYVDFENEYCIVLGPNMLDPIEAKKAGIEIRSWNVADSKIVADRDEIIDAMIAWCDAAKQKTKSELELNAWAQQIADDLKSAEEVKNKT